MSNFAHEDASLLTSNIVFKRRFQMKSQLITIIAACCMALIARAQQPTTRNFLSTEYHAGTQNWGITQNDSGVMFFANNNGMLAFDGDQWTTYPVPNASVVRSIYTSQGLKRIYVGASDEFGYFLCDENGSAIRYNSLTGKLPGKKRHFGEIWNIHTLGNRLVFQSKNNLFLVDRDEKITTFDFNEYIQTSIVIGNRMLISCRKGIFQFNGSSIRPLPGAEAVKGMNVCAILPFEDLILFVTDLNGIFAYDGKQCSPYLMDITDFLKKNQVFCATINSNYIAFGTVLEGAVIKNLKTGKTQFANRFNSLINNTVLSMKFDDMDNLWLGLDNGLGYVNNSSPFHELLSPSNNIGMGYVSYVKGNKLYLGTNQGLFYIDYPIPDIPRAQSPHLIPGLTGQVWMLEQIDDVLLCGADKGTFVIEDGKAQSIAGTDGTWNFVQLKKHPGYVISCDYRGPFILEKKGNTYVVKNRLQGFNEVSGDIYEDSDGTIWVAHWQKGVYHLWLSDDLTKVNRVEMFDGSNGLLETSRNKLCKIRNKIYVSSADGMYRYDPTTLKMKRDPEISRIFNTFGQSLRITTGQKGELWAVKADYCAVAYPKKDGTYAIDSATFKELAPRMQMTFGRFSPLDNDHMILTGNDGFYSVNNQPRTFTKTHATIIRSIKSTLRNDTLLYIHYQQRDDNRVVEIPHSLNSIRIEYVQPEYRGVNAISYQYILKGYDSDWSTPQTTTSKEYTGLSKGTYTFCVKAYNHITGKIDETSIKIKILPAWYETWIANLIYIILMGAALYYLFKYLKKRTERKFLEEKREKERRLREQQAEFEIENAKKEKQLALLKSEQLEVELKHKSSELADSTMNLIRKNDMLQELDESIKELSESVRREEGKTLISRKISDIRRSIKNNMTEDENWNRFEQNFNLVYNNFMQKLTAAFPDLKTNDKKLCAYLRMGLSSKEMASLLNTSVRSIETARYRLRKKLNMESGENLTDFIQHFENVEEGGQA